MKNETAVPKIPYASLTYLYHVAKLQNRKVSFETLSDGLHIYIGDFDFRTLESAINYLREDARMIVATEVVL